MLQYFMRRLITGLCLYSHNLFLPGWKYVEYVYSLKRVWFATVSKRRRYEIDRYVVVASFSAAV